MHVFYNIHTFKVTLKSSSSSHIKMISFAFFCVRRFPNGKAFSVSLVFKQLQKNEEFNRWQSCTNRLFPTLHAYTHDLTDHLTSPPPPLVFISSQFRSMKLRWFFPGSSPLERKKTHHVLRQTVGPTCFAAAAAAAVAGVRDGYSNGKKKKKAPRARSRLLPSTHCLGCGGREPER